MKMGWVYFVCVCVWLIEEKKRQIAGMNQNTLEFVTFHFRDLV